MRFHGFVIGSCHNTQFNIVVAPEDKGIKPAYPVEC